MLIRRMHTATRCATERIATLQGSNSRLYGYSKTLHRMLEKCIDSSVLTEYEMNIAASTACCCPLCVHKQQNQQMHQYTHPLHTYTVCSARPYVG
eukprot:12522-Heterococcus_DN1.PRE.1